MAKTNPLSIKEINVNKLFGHYSYKIPGDKLNNISQLLILYGDNGSGKTTILKIIFWILSTKDKSGFKTKLAGTKFSSFRIIFENGIEIGAYRESDIIGDYIYYIKENDKVIHSINLKTSPDLSIKLPEGSEEDTQFKDILYFIKNLNISVFYLSDDRNILNSLTSTENDNEVSEYEPKIISTTDSEGRIIRRMVDNRNISVESAIERLANYIRRNIITGSKKGEKKSQVIFTDIIKNVTSRSRKIGKAKTKNELIAEIELVQKTVTPYINLGLIDNFDSKTIIKSINDSKITQLKTIKTIIAPYIDSINAKLKALEKIKDILYLFNTSINNYFSNKMISFNPNIGFEINYKIGNEHIDFNTLSSGEKQLLLLFINTIISADKATIFIIDEPEISLNIKWQRNLIETLLKFSSTKNIQYLLATHSLEILSSYQHQVTKLEDVNG